MSSDIGWSNREAWCIRRSQGIDFTPEKNAIFMVRSEYLHQPPNKSCQLVSTFEVATDIWMITLLVLIVNVIWLRLPAVRLCLFISNRLVALTSLIKLESPLGLQLWLRQPFLFRVSNLLKGFSTVRALKKWWHYVVISGYKLFDPKFLYWGSLIMNGSVSKTACSRYYL